MAKKARRKLEEEEAAAFEFPVFDEVAFVTKEFEMAAAVGVAIVFTISFGIVSWLLSRVTMIWWAGFVSGFIGLIISPFAIQQLRAQSDIYTKADWAGLIALEFFGWLALWFVLINVTGL
jgi:hypothetical protein